MNERVVEILVYIMTESHDKGSDQERLELISNDLLQRGYTQTEISSAFSWLFERYKGTTEELFMSAEAGFPGSFRILNEAERSVISPRAYGYLLQLKKLGIINDIELEQIIERVFMVGGTNVTEDEIKTLVAAILFSPEGKSDKMFLQYNGHDIIQ